MRIFVFYLIILLLSFGCLQEGLTLPKDSNAATELESKDENVGIQVTEEKQVIDETLTSIFQALQNKPLEFPKVYRQVLIKESSPTKTVKGVRGRTINAKIYSSGQKSKAKINYFLEDLTSDIEMFKFGDYFVDCQEMAGKTVCKIITENDKSYELGKRVFDAVSVDLENFRKYELEEAAEKETILGRCKGFVLKANSDDVRNRKRLNLGAVATDTSLIYDICLEEKYGAIAELDIYSIFKPKGVKDSEELKEHVLRMETKEISENFEDKELELQVNHIFKDANCLEGELTLTITGLANLEEKSLEFTIDEIGQEDANKLKEFVFTQLEFAKDSIAKEQIGELKNKFSQIEVCDDIKCFDGIYCYKPEFGDIRNGIGFNAPAQWLQDKRAKEVVAKFIVRSEEHPIYGAVATITIKEENAEETDLDTFIENYITRLESLPFFDVIGIIDSKLSGIDGKKIIYTYAIDEDNNQYAKNHSVIVKKGNKAYIVEYYALEDKYDYYLIDVEKVISSVVIR